MINVKTIVIPKTNSTSSSAGSGSSGGKFKFEPHYLWGRYFDDTQDIDGDIFSTGTITGRTVTADRIIATDEFIANKADITAEKIAFGDIDTGAWILEQNDSSDFHIHTTLNKTFRVMPYEETVFEVNKNRVGINTNFHVRIDDTSILNASAQKVTIGTLLDVSTAHITDLDSETIDTSALQAGTVRADSVTSVVGNIDSVYSQTIDTRNLRAVEAYIKTLSSENITTDYLTVTKAAHFFKLVIDEIKSVGGNIIVTPANMVIDSVVRLQNGDYRCFARSTEEDKEIDNTWEVGDQAVCQTFNVHAGVNDNISNKYYWRLVTNTGSLRSVNFNNNSIKAIAVAHFDYNNDGDVTFDEIHSVTSLGKVFNTAEGNFDSFKYFTGLTQTSDYEFEGARLTKVTTPRSLRQIARYSFRYMSTLQEVHLNEGLTRIRDASFRQCTGLTTLTIPSTVSQIDYYALSRLYNLRYIRFKRANPATLGRGVLDETPATIYVPAESVQLYKSAWPDYADRIEADPYTDEEMSYYEEATEARFYIDLSDTDKDTGSNAAPEAGDRLVLLGNRTDATRQNAIIISAYDIDWLDKGDATHSTMKAPLIAQYRGISTYNLTPYRWSVISKDFNTFRGSFALNNGSDVE